MGEFRYLAKDDTLHAGEAENENDQSGGGTWIAPQELVWQASLASFPGPP